MSDKQKTTVSVCIPTYNQSAFIEQSVRSVFNQSYKPLEIIVSDDASTDDTLLVLEKLQLEISILKVLKNTKNLGITKNVNKCLKEAVGDLVVRLDSDDELCFHFIEKFVPKFEEFENVGYGHCAIQEIDEYNNHLKKRVLFRTSGVQSSSDALKASLGGYKVAANIIMFRKLALEKVEYLKSKIDFAEDYYLITSISEFGFDNIYINEILANYRVWVDKNKLRSRRKLSEIQGLNAVFTDVIEPAFIKRKWGLKNVYLAKRNFAVNHSDCLAWDNYSEAEKIQLQTEILKLSSSLKVRVVMWGYKNGFRIFIKCAKSLPHVMKNIIKTILKR